MKSTLPKVLHPLCGKPMIHFINKAVLELKPERYIIITSPRSVDGVSSEVSRKAKLIVQDEPLGTGHAVQIAEDALAGFEGPVVVICGDTPLITATTMRAMIKQHQAKQAVATVLTAKVDDPFGYGRVIRGNGGVKQIVEEKDATPAERHIREINTGTYCFQARDLFAGLRNLTTENAQNEYYLTDVIGLFNGEHLKVVAHQVVDDTEVLGVNSRIELADAEMILRARINAEHMKNGVTLLHPALTYIDADVKIGRDTIVNPLTFMRGKTIIGNECVIGPSCQITDSVLGDRVEVLFSVMSEVKVDDGVRIGPFTNVRPGSKLRQGSKVGSFVEIKKTTLGKGSKVPHLSYVGDAEIGEDVNVGAGAITCNFDGVKKSKTVIDDGAFIGSDTILVAPVKIGKNAYTGAGATIRKNVPDGALAVEHGEQKNFEGWVEKKTKNRSKKNRSS